MNKQKNSKAGIIFWNIMLFLNTLTATSYVTEDIKNPDTDTTFMVLLLILNTVMAGYGSYRSLQKYSDIKKLQKQR